MRLLFPLLAGLLAFSPPQTEDPESRLRLDNGLRVILKNVPHHEAVVTAIAYPCGTADDPKDRCGLAHVVEHLVFYSGTTSLKPYEAFETFQKKGFFQAAHMDANAETMHDMMYYYSILPPQEFDFQLRVESERMRTAKMSGEMLNKERPRVLNEITNVEHREEIKHLIELNRITYPDSGRGRPKAGTRKGVSAVTLQEAVNFYRTHYRPDRAVLVIYGKLPENAVSRVKHFFGKIPVPKEPAPEIPLDPLGPGGGRLKLPGLRGSPPLLLCSFQSAPPGSREEAALQIACRLLQLRFQKNKALLSFTLRRFVYETAWSRSRPAVYMHFSLTAANRKDPVLEAVRSEIRTLCKTPPAGDELEAARKQFTGELTANDTASLRWWKRNRNKYLENLAQLAINRLRLVCADFDRPERLLGYMKEISPEEISSAAAKYLKAERMNIVTVGAR